jgi:hypothetical protein
VSPSARRAALVAAALVALAIPGAVIGVLAARDGDDGAAGACELSELPSQGQAHVSEVEPDFPYNSFPPTSGPSTSEPAAWSRHEGSLAQPQLVHNLSHGGIVVQYGSEVPAAEVDRIAEWYRSDPDGLVVAPLPELGHRIALTAWTHLALCTGFDGAAFAAFRDAHRFEGPEPVSRDALRPQQPDADPPLLSDLSLWPRPFADTLAVTVTLEKDAAVNVTILAESGRVVRRLVQGQAGTAGLFTVAWDRRNDRGRRVPAGIYVVQVDAVAPDERASMTAATEAA